MPNKIKVISSKTILKTLNFILVALVGVSVSLGSYIYFSQNYSGNNGKDAQAATVYTCNGVGGTLSGTSCILDRQVSYNNTSGAAILGYSVTDAPYSTANGWTLTSGSIYNNYVDGLQVQLSDNAYNAEGTLKTSPSAGFFGQSNDARSGVLEMGKYRYVSEQKCFISGQQDEIFTRSPAYNTALIGKFDATDNSCAGTVAGIFASAYNVPISGKRYITPQSCAISGFQNELFLDGLEVNSADNCADTVTGTLASRFTIDLLGNRYLNVQNCAISGFQNEIFTYSATQAPDTTNSCSATVAGSLISLYSVDLLDTSRGAGNIQYQIVHAAAIASSDLTATDIPSLTVTCGVTGTAGGVGSGVVNSTTTCSFPMPPNKTVPTDFKLSIGTGSVNQLNCNNTTTPNTPGCNSANTAVAQACTLTSGTVTCNNIPTGNSVGNMPIYGNLGSGGSATKTATGETVNITGINFGSIDWIFNPTQGGNAPLFRSTDNTNITVRNFKTVFDPTPTSNTRYKCTLAYRPLNDRNTTLPLWDFVILTSIDYNTTTGCSFDMTKAMRTNKLNYSLRLTITDTTGVSTSPTPDYTFYNEYIYRFQGAGVASGG